MEGLNLLMSTDLSGSQPCWDACNFTVFKIHKEIKTFLPLIVHMSQDWVLSTWLPVAAGGYCVIRLSASHNKIKVIEGLIRRQKDLSDDQSNVCILTHSLNTSVIWPRHLKISLSIKGKSSWHEMIDYVITQPAATELSVSISLHMWKKRKTENQAKFDLKVDLRLPLL